MSALAVNNKAASAPGVPPSPAMQRAFAPTPQWFAATNARRQINQRSHRMLATTLNPKSNPGPKFVPPRSEESMQVTNLQMHVNASETTDFKTGPELHDAG